MSAIAALVRARLEDALPTQSQTTIRSVHALLLVGSSDRELATMHASHFAPLVRDALEITNAQNVFDFQSSFNRVFAA
jgi:hypothetical protein